MKAQQTHWWLHPIKSSIWAKGASELIPERFRRIITVVMPLVYSFLILFGTLGALFPVTTLYLLVGAYGQFWSFLVAATAFQSLIGLAFRLRIEIYSSLVLSVLLTIYPVFIGFLIFMMPHALDLSKLAVLPAIAMYPIMPAWRVFDIIFEIRRSRQRQLYAQAVSGTTP